MKRDINMEVLRFKEAVLNNLDFLVADYGFEGPLIDFDRPLTKTILYKKGSVGLDFSFDVKDGVEDVSVIKLNNGQVPDCFMKDKEGSIVKYLLEPALEKIGRTPYKYFKKGEKTLDGAMKNYKELLIHECPDILAGSAQVFDPLNEINKKTPFGDNF